MTFIGNLVLLAGILIPEPVKILFRILHAGDRKLISICEPYIDPVASLLVVVLVVMATVLGLIFAATQVYAEGDHLVRVTRNLINTTVSQNPELNKLLPEDWQSMMTSMVGNAFQYGREYISNMIRDSVAETNPEKAEQIERQVIELWDRIYLAWNQTWENAFTNVTHKNNKLVSCCFLQISSCIFQGLRLMFFNISGWA